MKTIKQLEKDIEEWDDPREDEGALEQSKEILWEIEKMLVSKEKELILWKHNLGKDGKKLKRKGFHKNPDFDHIASGYEQGLKEILSKLKGRKSSEARNG